MQRPKHKSRYHDIHSQDAGFVLPYVLVVIAILAIAGTIAAQRLQSANTAILDLQERSRSERILRSAEAAATFSILTGNPVNGGYDLSPQSPTVGEFGFLAADGKSVLSVDEAENIKPNIWPVNGGVRKYETSEGTVFIGLQDLTGVLSINDAGSPLFLNILKAAGVNNNEARKLVENLQDFIDFDNTRRPNGAEAVDYKFKNMLPPTNSPLRSYGELALVMDWAQVLPRLDITFLKDMTTIEATDGFREYFAGGTEEKSILGFEEDNAANGALQFDIIANLELDVTQPSSRVRLKIWAPRSDDRYDKRVVELMQTIASVEHPYYRRWVYDSTVLDSDVEKNIRTSTGRDVDKTILRPQVTRSNNTASIRNELKDVVHATSVRP